MRETDFLQLFCGGSGRILGGFHQADLARRELLHQVDGIDGLPPIRLRQERRRNEADSQIRFNNGKYLVCGSCLNIRLKRHMMIREKLPVEPIGTSMLPQ